MRKIKTKSLILALLLIASCLWFFSFYLKLPATGSGVGTHADHPIELKGVTYNPDD